MKKLPLVKRDTHLKFVRGVTNFCFTNQEKKLVSAENKKIPI